MNIEHIAELIIAIASVLGANRGFAYWRARRNGQRLEGNPCMLTTEDRKFFRDVMAEQTADIEKALENNRNATVLAIIDRIK